MQIFVSTHTRSPLLSASGSALVAALILAACGDSDDPVETADTGVDSGMDAGSDIAIDGQGGPDADAATTDATTEDTDTALDVAPDAADVAPDTTDTGASDATDTTPDDVTDTTDSDVSADAEADGSGEVIDDTELDLVGVYQDNFGGVHRIFNDVWVMGWAPDAPYFTIASFDDVAGVVIAQNGPENDFSPSLWSRFDWTATDGKLYFCQTAFNATSEAEAESTAAADADDLEGGCGGFGWSELVEGQGPLAITGAWVDNFESSHGIDSDLWTIETSTYAITQYDNALGYAIAQNGSDNEFSPDLWSRFDFAWDSFGTLYYCQTAFGAADEAAALATPAADRGGFDTDGCGGFPWSELLEPRLD